MKNSVSNNHSYTEYRCLGCGIILVWQKGYVGGGNSCDCELIQSIGRARKEMQDENSYYLSFSEVFE